MESSKLESASAWQLGVELAALTPLPSVLTRSRFRTGLDLDDSSDSNADAEKDDDDEEEEYDADDFDALDEDEDDDEEAKDDSRDLADDGRDGGRLTAEVFALVTMSTALADARCSGSLGLFRLLVVAALDVLAAAFA